MAVYKTKLIKKEEVAEGTMAFYFEKPDGFDFIAGQYVTVSLINPPETDNEGNSRFFSLITAPYENCLGVATRIRDTAFKRVLKNLPIGSEIMIAGPDGSFCLRKDASKPAVFLIGGIGITPVFSILKNAAYEKLPYQLFLFYSNKRPEDAAFLKELQILEKENKNFKLVATMTAPTESRSPDQSVGKKSKQAWRGETGFINKEIIQKHLKDLNSPIYYMSGPPQMVKAMRELAEKIGASNDNIKFEEFAGY
ncbi:MAG: oxidoreductase [Candidatus Terrybacteria bacterium RIFCSPLOWO2_02_42_20]|uniref:Oxidoreductase n=1 Tax=Candidatus Terrybacteria bacterium RIFCSPLOWO2_02_42_20 TaxID=1802370 RepID=A0A1G2PZR5_9BACT|nr:MAG: oxidoreductase [Candidatus Terrybacteria bacterium RIFCSPLOWO2_02_42_20]